MSEKKGLLEKMRYEFPTEAVLEVQIKGTWYRTTSREFRSFDGHRRYTCSATRTWDERLR